MLSTLSKHYLTSVALSAGLPAAVFILLVALLVVPSLPEGSVSSERLEALGPEWKTVVATIAALLLAALLVNLNIPTIRLFEGYPWKESYIGQVLTWRKRRRFQKRDAFWRGTRTLLQRLPKESAIRRNLTSDWNRVGVELASSFPPSKELVLPTRLGNTIRNFEEYPREKYGIYAVTSWPRLVAVIPRDYAAVIQEAKASLDFMLNGAVLSAALALLVLVVGLIWPERLREAVPLILWITEVAFFVAVSYGLYIMGVARAASWGNTVKSAFDLYRFDLLKELGYGEQPRTQRAEKTLWGRIGAHMQLGSRCTHPPLGYVPPWAEASDLDELAVTRSAVRTEEGSMVRLRVRNEGRRKADKATAIERVGGRLIGEPVFEDSGEAVAFSGTDPYRFSLKSLEPGEEVVVLYRAETEKGECRGGSDHSEENGERSEQEPSELDREKRTTVRSDPHEKEVRRGR